MEERGRMGRIEGRGMEVLLEGGVGEYVEV